MLKCLPCIRTTHRGGDYLYHSYVQVGTASYREATQLLESAQDYIALKQLNWDSNLGSLASKKI